MTTEKDCGPTRWEKWKKNQRRMGVGYRFTVTIPGCALGALSNVILVLTLGLVTPGWDLKYMFRALKRRSTPENVEEST